MIKSRDSASCWERKKLVSVDFPVALFNKPYFQFRFDHGIELNISASRQAVHLLVILKGSTGWRRNAIWHHLRRASVLAKSSQSIVGYDVKWRHLVKDASLPSEGNQCQPSKFCVDKKRFVILDLKVNEIFFLWFVSDMHFLYYLILYMLHFMDCAYDFQSTCKQRRWKAVSRQNGDEIALSWFMATLNCS